MKTTVFLTNGNGKWMPEVFRKFAVYVCGFHSTDPHFEAQVLNSSTYRMDVDEYTISAVRFSSFIRPHWTAETTPLWGVAGRWFLTNGQELSAAQARGLRAGELIVRYPWEGLAGAEIRSSADPLPMPELPTRLVVWDAANVPTTKVLTQDEAQALRGAGCRENGCGDFVQYEPCL